jgi:hypothetical protein
LNNEYTAQLIPYIDKLEVKDVKAELSQVQMMLCLQEKKHAFPTQAWTECFGTFLRARIYVAVVPGMLVSRERLYAMWNAAGNQRRSGSSNGSKITPYQETGCGLLGGLGCQSKESNAWDKGRHAVVC